jgi:predicted small lipoprotein YifL
MKRWARLPALGALLAAGAAAGCGQQGPLVLPEDARAVERVDAPAGEAEQTDDEQQDER